MGNEHFDFAVEKIMEAVGEVVAWLMDALSYWV